jgi:AraC-like DNA-binding protein
VVFFADGFVADLAGARMRPLGDLLDDPQSTGWLPIARRLWEGPNRLNAGMRALQGLIETDPEPGELDLAVRGLMDGCADLVAATRRELARLEVAKPATRLEVHRRVMRGKAWLDAHFDGPFDLAGAAAEACLSPHHFHRSFRAIAAESPFAYVARRRIDKAKTLLALTDDPVADVCAAVGYESLPAFTTRFRRQEGQPPAAWRKRLRDAR